MTRLAPPAGPVVQCVSCGADIVWTVTEAGRRMPVDAKPTGNGVALYRNPDDATTPRSKVVRVFVSHFATCPNAAQHRKADAGTYRCKVLKPDGGFVDGCGWQGARPAAGRCPSCGSEHLRRTTTPNPAGVAQAKEPEQ